ncbi:hypothetical protein [Anaerotruncus colihominis]|uniref:SHOCT domain-containing protein n=1 Tax=Anaerotruncus colihominis TaxID=169435 RepID=A0A845SRC3_9FIRM|nr:hypothetical protein [Anaerotruncus colihominis]MCR2024702.1 hypothetical protein [Anaerotruncus colihominis]NDO38235.1 hypothetical protein [Anaerotruncus colihominis]
MKKMLFALILGLCAGLSACASSQTAQGVAATSQMTQPIVTDNGLNTASGAAASSQPGTVSGTASLPASSAELEDILNQYYNIKAEVSALSVDIAILDADFRIGKIESAAFQEQKAALLSKRAEQEFNEDLLEHQAELLIPYTAPDPANTDVAALFEQLHEAEIAEDAADLEGDILKEHYRTGQISREEFVSQKAVLERKADEADRRADILEDTLEMLGFDD